MNGCSFEKLIDLLDGQLSADRALVLFDHLDRCAICRQAIHQMCRDRRQSLSTRRTYRTVDHGLGVRVPETSPDRQVRLTCTQAG
jgi:anti-sigma factor RsiW